jgi:hypothetical protein
MRKQMNQIEQAKTRTLEEIRYELNKVNAEIAELNIYRRELEAEQINSLHPFPDGAKIRNKRTGAVVFYAGIDRVWGKSWEESERIWILIRKIKKNGEAYASTQNGYNLSHWEDYNESD